MYHPFALDLIRVQQEELRQRAALTRWSQEAVVERRRRRQWWPLPRPLTVRWATAARPCPDC
jgi:hypothetical protein